MEPLFATDQTRALVPRIREFVQNELVPLESAETLTGRFSKVAQLLDQKRELVRRAGLWGLQHSRAEGGLGLSLCEFGQVSEALAWSPFGHYAFNCQAPDIGNMELLGRHASEAIRNRFLEPLKAGNVRSCFSMTEPEFAGSNPTQLGTTARREGSHYIINGHKWFTTAADGAAFAVVMAVTDPTAPPHRRASMLLVPTDSPGFELVRNISIMGDPSDHWGSHAEVRYHDVRVPAEYLIGEEGLGFALAQERLGPGRIHHCMRWIGIAERCFDLMCRRAATRELEPGLMLGEKQFIQGFIAESRVELDASRLLVLRTARNIDEQGAAAVRNEISAIKFFVANMMLRVVDRAIQVFGALGVTDDVLLAWYYRHERGARIYDGADEVHKTVLARSILKEYGLDTRRKN